MVQANHLAARKQDPAPALSLLQEDLSRCFTIAAQDAMCRTLAAQAAWVSGNLPGALEKARLATQSPEKFPEAWYSVAETHLRIARLPSQKPPTRDPHIAEGLAAVHKLFAINPNHALGQATQGALLLLRSQAAPDPALRRSAAEDAIKVLEQAIHADAFLTHSYTPLLDTARALAASSN